MPQRKVNVSLVYFVVFALLLIGLVPLLLTGYFLSERSAGELRAVENRYQIQLVQEKGRQIEMFGRRHTDLVRGLANAFALANDQKVFGLPQTDRQLSNTLRENPDVLAVYVQPATGEPLALYRPTSIVKTEIDGIAQDVVRMIGNEPLYVGDPQIAGAAKEPVITMASSATNEKGRIATVVAIISLKSISRAVVGADQATEKELWDSGRPIVFVVDQNGRALFHPDVRLVQGGSVLSDLKIVSEWQESYRQIQSGLVPFSSEFDGAKHVTAIELDRGLAPQLADRFANDSNFSLVEADALEVNFGSLVTTNSKLVANLPYNISTAILHRLSDQRNLFSEMVLMFQREVVERITAKPGTSERGFLTVIVESCFEVEKLFDVPPSAFRPVPKVWSSVVRLIPKSKSNFDELAFRTVVSTAFGQKRKTILNNLKVSWNDAEECLNAAGISIRRRAESLTPDEWRKLTECISTRGRNE